MSESRTQEQTNKFYERVLALAERFEFNVQIFVAIVAIACLVEVILGWNAFLKEVTLIRGRLERKAVSYLGVLSRATLNPILSYDWDQMDLYSRQMFEDEDVVFIRFVDARGQVIFDSLRPEFGEKFRKRYNKALKEKLSAVLARDVKQVMFSPEKLDELKALETKETLINRFNNFVSSIEKRFGVEKKSEKQIKSLIHYQDSLKGDVDDFSFGIVVISDKRKRTWGAVVLGFSLTAVNEEINASLMQNLAMTLFFVLLVAVNQYLTRREKLAAKAMADDIAKAKEFFSAIIPDELPQMEGMHVEAKHFQSPNLGGGFYSFVKSGDDASLVVANAATTGLASSYAASMFEALTLRRLHSQPELLPKDFVKGVRKDFELANVGGSIDMVVARFKKENDEIIVDYVAAGMEPPIVFHERNDLLASEQLLRRGGNGISQKSELTVEVGHLNLVKGDRLVFFNDGLSDDSDKRTFKAVNLRQAILNTAEVETKEAVNTISTAASTAYEDMPPDDLITIVVDVTDSVQ